MDKLKRLLTAIDVSYTEVIFDSQTSVTELGSSLFVSVEITNAALDWY